MFLNSLGNIFASRPREANFVSATMFPRGWANRETFEETSRITNVWTYPRFNFNKYLPMFSNPSVRLSSTLPENWTSPHIILGWIELHWVRGERFSLSWHEVRHPIRVKQGARLRKLRKAFGKLAFGREQRPSVRWGRSDKLELPKTLGACGRTQEVGYMIWVAPSWVFNSVTTSSNHPTSSTLFNSKM
jgi:hypothetical protein